MQSPSQAFEQFRALVERDPSLRERLYRPDDPEVFTTLVVEAARDHGLSLDAAEVDTAFRPRRPISARSPPGGWLPVRAGWRDHEFIVDWAYLGARRLREPFFEETATRCLTKPFNRLFKYSTPIDALAGRLRDHPGLPPAGFIFHLSRCGSTLMSARR